MAEFKGRKYVQSNRRRKIVREIIDAGFEARMERPGAKECETVDEFLARGGSIRTYAYKRPPVWKQTFNGFSKFDKRK